MPPRASFTITFGDLPEGWNKRQRTGMARTWIGLVGLVLIAPFIFLVAAYLLQAVGFHGPYDSIAASAPAILAATLSLFIGFPIAFVLNVVPIARPLSGGTPAGWRSLSESSSLPFNSSWCLPC